MKKELIKNMVSLIVGEALLEFIENPTSPKIVNDLREKYSEKILSAIDSMQEEPVSEQKLSNVERIGKNWKEESDLNWKDMSLQEKKDLLALLQKDIEPVSEKFEKALAEEWKGYNERGAALVDALEDNTQELAFAKGFYRGANWQNEQMMAKAVEGIVREDSNGYLYVYAAVYRYNGFSRLDKVKAIIIKEG